MKKDGKRSESESKREEEKREENEKMKQKSMEFQGGPFSSVISMASIALNSGSRYFLLFFFLFFYLFSFLSFSLIKSKTF